MTSSSPPPPKKSVHAAFEPLRAEQPTVSPTLAQRVHRSLARHERWAERPTPTVGGLLARTLVQAVNLMTASTRTEDES